MEKPPVIWTKDQAQRHIPASTMATKTKAQRLIQHWKKRLDQAMMLGLLLALGELSG